MRVHIRPTRLHLTFNESRVSMAQEARQSPSSSNTSCNANLHSSFLRQRKLKIYLYCYTGYLHKDATWYAEIVILHRLLAGHVTIRAKGWPETSACYLPYREEGVFLEMSLK